MTLFYASFHFYLSPIIYEKYKLSEYDLRNNIDFEKFVVSNFVELNNNTILDFEKKDKNFKNIFIKVDENTDSIIFAKKGLIISELNNHKFNLIDGFKIDILENEIEKLQFNSYSLLIPKKNKIQYDNLDKKTNYKNGYAENPLIHVEATSPIFALSSPNRLPPNFLAPVVQFEAHLFLLLRDNRCLQ